MAQRFGGKFSPTGAPSAPAPDKNSFHSKRPTKAGFRSNLLFFLPIPFLWKAFFGDPVTLILGLFAAALMLLGAWMTREGLFAQEAYEARSIARRPALPRKVIGAMLIGAGLGCGVLMSGQGSVIAAALATLATFLHLGAFGFDPLANKGVDGLDDFQTDRVAKAVDTGEAHLKAMKDAILRARDRQLEGRVDHFADTARALFRTVENDPRDLTAARKYLGIYLQGAREATVKFVDLYAQSRDAKMRADYDALLTDLDTNFASRTTALLADNHTDLNVEIEVLRERLAFENR
ncbi:5-bromo-4-chloroindolyl phosphate hydrolysis family protein [Pseudorhodobacter sp. W20_MBD10_FR17]|uniref:5-bromo-4-chloroindolyl phosphate hydrolysis family protein n=1 Tax=Pseudorhodobacter sp. W20_MBD10_FR17 TaxID=3240266 RepID=UPI003F9910EE